MRSIVAFRIPQAAIATRSEPTIAAISDPVEAFAFRWKTERIIVAENIPPSMKTSPCAKLISSRIP